MKLIQELNHYNYRGDLEEDNTKAVNVADGVSSLQLKLCTEVKEQAKKLEEESKELKEKVAGRRQYVIQLISDESNMQQYSTAIPPFELSDVASPEKKKPNFAKKKEFIHSSPLSSKIQHHLGISGKVNMDRCERCEDLDDEEVCGDNGKTYRSLCHAVNCAGLALQDVSTGSCITKVIFLSWEEVWDNYLVVITSQDVCASNPCGNNLTCIPMVHGICLALYSSDGLRKLPCRQYICGKYIALSATKTRLQIKINVHC